MYTFTPFMECDFNIVDTGGLSEAEMQEQAKNLYVIKENGNFLFANQTDLICFHADNQTLGTVEFRIQTPITLDSEQDDIQVGIRAFYRAYRHRN